MSNTSAAFAAYRKQNIMSLHNNMSVGFQEDITPEAFSIPVDVNNLNVGQFHYRFRMKHPDQSPDSTYIRDVRGAINTVYIAADYLTIKYNDWATGKEEIVNIRITDDEVYSYILEAHAVFHWRKFTDNNLEIIINDWESFWVPWTYKSDKRLTMLQHNFVADTIGTLGHTSEIVYSFDLDNSDHRAKLQDIVSHGHPFSNYYYLENEMPKEWGSNQPIPDMPDAASSGSYGKPVGDGNGYVIPPMPDEISSVRKPTKNWWGTQTSEGS